MSLLKVLLFLLPFVTVLVSGSVELVYAEAVADAERRRLMWCRRRLEEEGRRLEEEEVYRQCYQGRGCRWSRWSEWSDCTRYCDTSRGTRTRTRSSEVDGRFSKERDCLPQRETQSCTTDKCKYHEEKEGGGERGAGSGRRREEK